MVMRGPLPTPDVLASPSFVAVDFETANRAGGISACQIALVRFIDDEPVDTLNTLIRPPAEYSRFEFTYIHGITAADVVDAPTWDDIAWDVARFAADDPVWAHNSAFDLGVWRALDAYYGTTSAPETIFCSYKTARKFVPGLPNYKLPTVTKHFAPDFELNHREAGADAEACGLIVSGLRGITVF